MKLFAAVMPLFVVGISMVHYHQGKVDYDKAKTNFETAIKERYPDITEVKWPE